MSRGLLLLPFAFALGCVSPAHKEPAPVVESSEASATQAVRLWRSISTERHNLSREEFDRRVILVGKPTMRSPVEQCFDSYVLVDWAYVKRSDCYETYFGRVRSFKFDPAIPKDTKLFVRSSREMVDRLRAAGFERDAQGAEYRVHEAGGHVMITSDNIFDTGSSIISLETGVVSIDHLCARYLTGCLPDQDL